MIVCKSLLPAVCLGACVCLGGQDRQKPYTISVKPGDSLEAARDAARALSASDRAKGVEIVLAPGTYRRSAVLQLDAQDSGVMWRSAGGGRAVISSGIELKPQMFKRISAVDTRVDPVVREKVLVADLSSANLWMGDDPKGEFRVPPVPDLFVDGRRMTVASWPNEGWDTIAKFIDPGTDIAAKKRKESPRGGTFGYSGDRPSRWTKAPRVWLHGFWCFDWDETIIPVASINAVSNSITLAVEHQWGIKQGNPAPRRWRAVHLLEELDVPGEYYADMDGKKLYLYPPKTFGPSSRVEITQKNRKLLSVAKAADIVFRGIDFTEATVDAVVLKNCERVAFEKCRFYNLRAKAISASGCTECRVVSCDIHDVGSGGVYIGGGDRKTLTPGKNLVEDCLIKDFSVHCLTYASAIHLSGCGNIARHNELTGAPHMAVGIDGNDHVFEYNVVSNVCMSSDDAGALYKGRNPSCRGNVIRYNFWSEIGSPRGHGNAAIYFDDADGGDYVLANVFYRCGEPGFGNFGSVFCHGGYSNIVANCVFVECKRPLGSAPWPNAFFTNFLNSAQQQRQLTKEVDIRKPPYTTRYPELVGFLDPQPEEVRWNAAYNNVFVNCPLELPGRKPGEKRPGIVSGRWYTNSTDVVFSGDPGFYDMRGKDFRLRKDSEIFKKIPRFRPLRFEKIGLLTKRTIKEPK